MRIASGFVVSALLVSTAAPALVMKGIAAEEAAPKLQCPGTTVLVRRVREQWCEKGASVRHGPFVSWHTDGTKAMEGEYRDGQLTGHWVAWHRNGQKSREGDYRDGKEQGQWTFWREDGTKELEVTFRDGVEVARQEMTGSPTRLPSSPGDKPKELIAFLDKYFVYPDYEWLFCSYLATNPFALEGKGVIVPLRFEQMLERDKGLFLENRTCGVVASAIPARTFLTQPGPVMLVGRVVGNIEAPVGPPLFFGSRLMPHVKFVAVYRCREERCTDVTRAMGERVREKSR